MCSISLLETLKLLSVGLVLIYPSSRPKQKKILMHWMNLQYFLCLHCLQSEAYQWHWFFSVSLLKGTCKWTLAFSFIPMCFWTTPGFLSNSHLYPVNSSWRLWSPLLVHIFGKTFFKLSWINLCVRKYLISHLWDLHTNCLITYVEIIALE
jgi:hypothetical protein